MTPSDYEILKNSYENNKHTQREIGSEKEYDDMLDTFETEKKVVAKATILMNTGEDAAKDPTTEQKENIVRLREEQKDDETLTECWKDATESADNCSKNHVNFYKRLFH